MDNTGQASGPLKIAYVIDTYDNVRNGAVISTQRFKTLLHDLYHHQITIISTGDQQVNKIVVPAFYPPFARKTMKQLDSPFGWPDKKLLRKELKKIDLIHVQFPFFLSMRTITLAHEFNIPVVATFHVQAEHILNNVNITSPFIIRCLYKLFIKAVYNRCDAVICPSRFAEDELKRYGLKKPSHIISNGFLPYFKPLEIKRPEENENYFVILTVGRLSTEKHQEILIQAIRQSRYKQKIKLIVIGSGPLAEKFKKLIKEYGILADLQFDGIRPEEMPYYYSTADLYIHTSTIEVECMAVLEGMACGLPPLISNSEKSAAKQFALDNRSLFTPLNSEDLATKIAYWIENPDELKQAKALYHEYAQQFSIDRSVCTLEKVYRQCIEESKASEDEC